MGFVYPTCLGIRFAELSFSHPWSLGLKYIRIQKSLHTHRTSASTIPTRGAGRAPPALGMLRGCRKVQNHHPFQSFFSLLSSPETSLVWSPQSALCICKRADRTRPRTRVAETIPGWDLRKWNSKHVASCMLYFWMLKTSIAFSVYVTVCLYVNLPKGLHCRHTWPRFLPMPDLSVQRRGTTAALKANKAKHIKASDRTFMRLSFIVATWWQVREQNKIPKFAGMISKSRLSGSSFCAETEAHLWSNCLGFQHSVSPLKFQANESSPLSVRMTSWGAPPLPPPSSFAPPFSPPPPPPPSSPSSFAIVRGGRGGGLLLAQHKPKD